MVRTHGKVVQAAPPWKVQGSCSDPQGGLGSAQSLWQCQQHGLCVLRGLRAMGGTLLQCPPVPMPQVTGVVGGAYSQTHSGGAPHPPLKSEMPAVVWRHCPIAHTRGSLPSESLSVLRERYSYDGPALTPLAFPTMMPCLSCVPKTSLVLPCCGALFPSCCVTPLVPQAVCTQPDLVLSPKLTSEAWVSAPRPCLSVVSESSGTCVLCGSLSALPFLVWLLHFSLRLWVPPSGTMASKGAGSFPLSRLPLRSPGPILIPFYPSFLSLFFLLFYPVMWRISCSFWRFKVFCKCSIDILWESFYM